MQNNNRGNLSTSSLLGIATASLVVGAAALYFSQPAEVKVKSKSKTKFKQSEREKEQVAKLLEQQNHWRRRVNLYFDENDEMVEKEESDNDQEQGQPGTPNDMLDDLDLQKKLIKLKQKQMLHSRTKITVNIGEADYDFGKKQITKDIFDGRDKTENAEMFIENLIKTRKLLNKSEQGNQTEGEMADVTKSSDSPSLKKVKNGVIMDLDPKNYHKDKDKIFMDFFSLYGKNFIHEQKQSKSGIRPHWQLGQKSANTTGNITPLSKQIN